MIFTPSPYEKPHDFPVNLSGNYTTSRHGIRWLRRVLLRNLLHQNQEILIKKWMVRSGKSKNLRVKNTKTRIKTQKTRRFHNHKSHQTRATTEINAKITQIFTVFFVCFYSKNFKSL